MRTAVLLLFIITSNVFIVFIMRVRRISYFLGDFLHARPVRGGMRVSSLSITIFCRDVGESLFFLKFPLIGSNTPFGL